MRRFSLTLLALSALAAGPMAGIHPLTPRDLFIYTWPYLEPLLKMKVYLKGDSRTPPLDSFRLAQGKSEIWRWEHESAVFKVGRKVAHRLADIDSVVLEKHGIAFPSPTGEHLLFLQETGAISYYAFVWDATGLPPYLKKGDGPVERSDTRTIRLMVSDDPEATALIGRYERRWRTRLSIAAAGASLIAFSVALAAVTLEEDENGEKKPSTVVPGIVMAAGLVTLVVPLTPYLNFIWNRLPKRALDTYNRNRKTAP